MSNTERALSNWQEQYMTATQGYPIAVREEQIVPLLNRDFTRAVIFRHPQLASFLGRVSALADQDLADRYWHDENEKRKRRASGKEIHRDNISTNIVITESAAANIRLSAEDVISFTHKCNAIRDLFIRVYNEYAPHSPFVAMRGFTLFTPVGGQGRSPELHIDNTILTAHWAAALATFRVHDGDLPDDVWDLLSMIEKKKKTEDVQAADFQRLIKLAKELPMVENKVGDLTISKGQLGQDLSIPEIRQQMCVHVSSGSITERGQAGFLLTPEMPKPPIPA